MYEFLVGGDRGGGGANILGSFISELSLSCLIMHRLLCRHKISHLVMYCYPQLSVICHLVSYLRAAVTLQ